MMKKYLVVDANNQTAFSRERVGHLLQRSSDWRLLLVGTPDKLNAWRKELAYYLIDERAEVIEIRSQNKGGTMAHIGFVLADRLRRHNEDIDREREWTWWLIGLHAAMNEMAALIEATGSKAKRVTRLTEEHLGSTEAQQIIRVMLDATLNMKKAHGSTFNTSELAEEVFRLQPSLKSEEERKRIFGNRRFSQIAKTCGMQCKGNTIYAVPSITTMRLMLGGSE